MKDMKKTVTERNDSIKYYTGTKLKERGWTDSLIKRFLGKPDLQHKNRNSYGYSNLYVEDRVHEAENTSAWKEAAEKAKKRSEAGKKAAETQRVNLLNDVSKLVFGVSNIPLDQVRMLAVEAYNEHKWSKFRGENIYLASLKDSDQDFLDRITVNYIRHNETDYEYELYQTAGRIGKFDAYFEIIQKVYDAIAARYPDLSSECYCQMLIKKSWSRDSANAQASDERSLEVPPPDAS